MKSFQNIFGIIMWAVLCVSALFTVSQKFSDPLIVPKWMATLSVFTLSITISSVILLLKKKFIRNRCLTFLELEIVTSLVCFFEAVWAILQVTKIAPRYSDFISGTFDNPAGLTSCLCLSFPLGMEHYQEWKPWKKILFALIKMTSAIALFLSGSRTGMVCLVLIIMILFLSKRRMWIKIGGVIIFLALFIGAFMCKKDSTNGRWFIVQRTWEMIRKRPFFGWGSNGFVAHYMDFQAAYLKQHPLSKYALLADNIRHPMNEYLNFLVSYGCMGLLAIFGLAILTCWYYYHHPTSGGKIGLQILVVWSVFSLFSYPSLYPFTWIMILTGVFCIYYPLLERFLLDFLQKRLLYGIIFIMSLGADYYLYTTIKNEWEWQKIEYKSFYGQSEKMMPHYARLYPEMKSNPYFLYNYSAEQYNAGKYQQALKTALECRQFWSDYDLELMTGDIYQALNRSEKAIQHYQMAYCMCPSRLLPLEGWLQASSQLKDSAQCRILVRKVMNMPLKIKSTEVLELKNRILRMYQPLLKKQ